MKTKFSCAVHLAVLLAAAGLASTAAAQDDDSQSQPHWRARTTARQYPDDERQVRNRDNERQVQPTSAAEDVPLDPPLPVNVDSPSNAPARRANSRPAGSSADSSMAPASEPIAAPHATRNHGAPAPRYDDAYDNPHPSTHQSEIYGDDGEANCGDDDFGACFPGLRCMAHDHLWFRGESLLWWTKGGQTPPLLTTSPASTPLAQAGVLGQPGTSVLFGDQEMNQGLHAGARISFGTWFGCCEEYGVEFSYFILGENTQNFTDSSMGNPILARPFFNTTTGAEDSHIIAYPNVANGTFTSTSTENFNGAEALFRRALVRGCDGRVDLVLGYRFARLTDGLLIADAATSSGGSGSIAPAGTTISTLDIFNTRNDFNGGDVGFATEWRRGRWGLETLLKLGIGDTQTQVVINGATGVTSNGSTSVATGGLLALPSNIGTHDSNQFSVMPELGLTLTCDVTEHLRARVGYTLLYWSNVARPGDQIDLNVDTNQFPPPIATGEKPAFVLHTSDFWAQGVNLGLDYRF
jgi:hypothetical protein